MHGFPSEDILASEKNEWTVGGDMLNRENTFMPKHRNSYFEYDTWAGADNRSFKKSVKTNKIVTYIRQRNEQWRNLGWCVLGI